MGFFQTDTCPFPMSSITRSSPSALKAKRACKANGVSHDCKSIAQQAVCTDQGRERFQDVRGTQALQDQAEQKLCVPNFVFTILHLLSHFTPTISPLWR